MSVSTASLLQGKSEVSGNEEIIRFVTFPSWQLLPKLFGHKRDQGVKHLQRGIHYQKKNILYGALVCSEFGGTSLRLAREIRLSQFQVDGGKFVLDKVVENLDRLTE